jgi:hypothetical protein
MKGHAREQRGVLAPPSGHRMPQSLAPGRVSVDVDRRHRSVGPALVHEEEPLGRDLRSDHHPPGRPQEPVALGGYSPPFFLVEPSLAMARHIVERLTQSPVVNPKYSQRSLRVANGRSARSSRSSFIDFSSSFRPLLASSSKPGIVPFGPCLRTFLQRRGSRKRCRPPLGLGHAAHCRGDYPSPEIFGVSAHHASMFSSVHYRCNAL